MDQVGWLRQEVPGQVNAAVHEPEQARVEVPEQEPLQKGTIIFENGLNYIVDENGTELPDHTDLYIDGKYIGNILENRKLDRNSLVYLADKHSLRADKDNFREDVKYVIPRTGGKSRRKSRRKSRKSKRSRRRRRY